MKHKDIKEILSLKEGIESDVVICGWIKKIRKSKRIIFAELNDGTSLKNLQLVVEDTDDKIYNLFSEMTLGSSVKVVGKIVKSLSDVQNVEMLVKDAIVLGTCPLDYPIQKQKQNLEYFREMPHLRVRTNTFNAMFRVRSVLSKSIHDFLQDNNFLYIHTPIITGSDCEGAGELFKITTFDLKQVSKEPYDEDIYSKDFFGKKVALTLSGQLEAEAMACALGKVYTFGPTFRAENSNTKRHAAEFWMIEVEQAFAELEDSIKLVNDFVKYLINDLLLKCKDEIEFFAEHYDKDLKAKLATVIENDFARITYTEVIELLNRSGLDFKSPVYWVVI